DSVSSHALRGSTGPGDTLPRDLQDRITGTIERHVTVDWSPGLVSLCCTHVPSRASDPFPLRRARAPLLSLPPGAGRSCPAPTPRPFLPLPPGAAGSCPGAPPRPRLAGPGEHPLPCVARRERRLRWRRPPVAGAGT